jgi:hopene-associated glycosyltransferase HpnB
VWALEQASRHVVTPYLLLLDADIALKPGVLTSLRRKLIDDGLALASLMAELRTETFWERLLAPAYVYFFRLLYPFSLVRAPRSRIAAAAGGCVLLKYEALQRIGGFAAIRAAIIDDCSLARAIKGAGYPIWLGLTRDVLSLRPYEHLSDFWSLVSRSAFAELDFSLARLLACTVGMLALFAGPIALAAELPHRIGVVGIAGLIAMLASYVPILRYYGLSTLRCATLPLVAAGYLLMTWHSALRYWQGTRTVWKGRAYSRQQGSHP